MRKLCFWNDSARANKLADFSSQTKLALYSVQICKGFRKTITPYKHLNFADPRTTLNAPS
jgi:hypothetical protein